MLLPSGGTTRRAARAESDRCPRQARAERRSEKVRGTLRSELGDALRASGQHGDAKKAYEAALKIAEQLNDLRGQGVDLARLGALALTEGNLEEALTRHLAAQRLFQRLHEPDDEAAACHQLGRVYQEQRQSDEAERHYQEAARISEDRGRLAEAAQTWNELAVLEQETGKLETAEGRYRKSARGRSAAENSCSAGTVLNSLADLLQNRADRVAEARQLVEEALAVRAQRSTRRPPKPGSTYGILADIVDA